MQITVYAIACSCLTDPSQRPGGLHAVIPYFYLSGAQEVHRGYVAVPSNLLPHRPFAP